jgi:indole-3-glycerol phosphate synthase
MANVLDKIIEDKKESLKVIKNTNSLDSLENTIKSLNNLLNFKDAISNNSGVSLIAEIKK